MNRRPPNEPSRKFAKPNRLWNDSTVHPMSLGCVGCLERNRCGGVHTDAGVLDCKDLCTCLDKSTCDMVCRFNPSQFVRRMREIGGSSFDNVPRMHPLAVQNLPLVTSLIDHKIRRSLPLQESTIALSLYDIVNLRTGKAHAHNREELAERFLISPHARLIISGVNRDDPIERWWELKNRHEILSALAHLDISLMTSPNYSVLTDVPRTDNLHSMKRILIAWAEMIEAGIAAALHINARTEYDYQRWIDLISERSEIQAIAFEFGTGSGFGDRIDWHVNQLCRLADQIARPLTLVMRGGTRKARKLSAHFSHVTLIDTEAFSRMTWRRKAILLDSGRIKWARHPTPEGAPLDDLLAHNVATVRAGYEKRLQALPTTTSSVRVRRRANADSHSQQGRLL
jgi:Domain of unknown function (DUF4417)